jgi:two-component system osmolarity sensor histidine kinase EnvZ
MTILLAPMVLVVAVATIVFVERHWDNVTRRLASDIASEVHALSDLLEYSSMKPSAVKNFIERNFDLQVLIAPQQLPKRIVSIDGEKPIDQPFMEDALYERFKKDFTVHVTADNIFIVFPSKYGMVSVSLPRKRLFNKTAPVFLMWLLGTPILLSLIAAIFLRNQIRPIRRLAEAADKLGKGQEIEDFQPRGADEVRQAGYAFIRMRDRLQRQISKKMEMLAGVSHDLRTPLTRMSLQLSMMKDSDEIEGLKRDVSDMSKMVTSFLDFARENETEATSSIDICELIHEIATRQAKEVHVKCDVKGKLNLRVQSIKRCLVNILENASRYADESWISVTNDPERLFIVIDDNGPGIPENKRALAFKPFYRLDESRNQDVPGTGLGLAIARDVIHQHGGKIHLEDSPKGGLRVSIKIPL